MQTSSLVRIASLIMRCGTDSDGAENKTALKFDLRSALISCNTTFTEGAVLQIISTSMEGLHTNKHTVSQGLNGLILRDRSLGLTKFCLLSYLQRKVPLTLQDYHHYPATAKAHP